MALDMFDTFESESFHKNAFHKRIDFLTLAEFYGMDTNRAGNFLDRFAHEKGAVADLLDRSFLSQEAKTDFLHRFHDRLRAVED